MQRLLLLVAGLIGAGGVAAAAAASHAGESRNLAAIAAICLAHGPALLAVGLLTQSPRFHTAGFFLALGSVVFAGDLALREWLGHSPFPGVAPLGGGAMVLGWLALGIIGLVRPPKN